MTHQIRVAGFPPSDSSRLSDVFALFVMAAHGRVEMAHLALGCRLPP